MLAQVSIEFISLISILTIFLLLTLYYSSSFYFQINSAKVFKDSQTISDQIASEINLALKAGNGYSRVFFIPKKISNSIEYEVKVENYRVVISWSNGSTQSVILTKNITGEILKGKNLIKNLDGVIYVNQ